MFKKYNYSINLVEEPFENLRYRDKTVLILCKDKEGKYILGAKSKFYPEGIIRLVGGGVNENESLINAAIREIKEETGIKVTPKELTELAEIDVTGTYKDKTYKTKIFTYFFGSENDDYLANDDVSEIVKYSEEDYKKLVNRFYELKDDFVYSDSNLTFSWGDFGKVYGFVHEVTLNEFLARNI